MNRSLPLAGNILIVDDSEENLRLLTTILHGAGYKVQPAINGELALRSIEANNPALILLDIMMPGIDGLEMCRKLKSTAKTGNIPIIIVSALKDIESKTEGFKAGAVDYITKPFNKEEILNRVKTHIELRQSFLNLEDLNLTLRNEIELRLKHEAVADGSRKALLSVVEDEKLARKDLKTLNEELEQRVIERTNQLQIANNELEAFSYSVSHDLRAPLRAVHSFTKILSEDYGEVLDAEGKRICGIIESSSVHMGQLIDDLLAFSRIGRTEFNRSKINMASLTKSIYSDTTTPAERTRIDFNVSKLPTAYGDITAIKQVITNLLSNALKYSSNAEKSEIIVGFECINNETVYYIKDNGVGFEMKYAPKLFGMFQRLHSAKEFEGNGVGLAIVQRIIHRHGGRVWAEAEVGKGATFYFTLPGKKSDG